jgi:hypothetical protein
MVYQGVSALARQGGAERRFDAPPFSAEHPTPAALKVLQMTYVARCARLPRSGVGTVNASGT